MSAKIPATVVTGFLGAGKTSLIKGLIAAADGKRLALIINEFGDLGVDGELVKGGADANCGVPGCADEDVLELANGCICCAVADEFLPAMQTLLARDPAPDHIVIETSGLALPQPLLRAFNWPEIRAQVTVDGVITVVDGAALDEGRFAADEAAVDRQRAADDQLSHETPLSELFADQLACADLILVNKTDLLAPARAERLVATLGEQARAGVRVLPAAHAAAPAAVVLGLGVGVEDDLAARAEIHHRHGHDHDHDHDHDQAHPGQGQGQGQGHGHDHAHHDHGHDHAHHDHGHDAFESFVVTAAEVADADDLAARLSAVIAAHGLLRVKGFAAVARKPMRLVVQAVGPRVTTHFDRPLGPDAARETRLVVIGEVGIDRLAVADALGARLVGG